MNLAITPPPLVTLPVEGTDLRFPVGRIFCVGRNYAAHAREMGHDPDREPPFFFMKAADSVVQPSLPFPYPAGSSNVHHEIELVIAIGTGGEGIAVDDALDHVFGYAVGLDMTRRDRQGEAKKLGRPWEVGKSFAASAPMSAVWRVEDVGHPSSGHIHLDVDGERRQDGDLNQLIWSCPEVISFCSDWFGLQPGDLIMTGTPAGVGPVERGQVMSGGVEGLGSLVVEVV